MSGRFISTHSVVLALPMRIRRLPERGSAVVAESAMATPGGGFTVLSVAAAQGVQACMASPLGTGPNSFTVRQRLTEAGIQVLTEELVGDIGVAVLLVEEDGSTTSVVTQGVESEPSRSALLELDLHPGDLVHISGADLVNPLGAEALSNWGADLPDYVTLVVSVAPAVEQVQARVWKKLLARADIVTMNIREASALTRILSAQEPGTGIRHVVRPGAAIVRRLGLMGCEVQETVESRRVQIPAFDAVTVDTNGVGDTHIGTMCACLIKGQDLMRACTTANAASSLMISHEMSFPAPTQREIDQVLARGRIQKAPR